MAAKKKSASVKAQLKKADKKVKATGAIMTKKEREELLGMVKTTKKKAPAKKKAAKKK